MPVSSLPMIDAGVNLADKGWVTKEYIMEVYPELLADYRSPGLLMWGAGTTGAIGDGFALNRSSPTYTLSDSTKWKSIEGGGSASVGIKDDGTLWNWGNGGSGALGDNTVVSKSSPIQTVALGTNWVSGSSGYSHTAGIKSDGTLWLWGNNLRGQLGTNDSTYYSSPVQTVLGGTDWKTVSCANLYSFAIKTNGSLYSWGLNLSGVLGLNEPFGTKSSPVLVNGDVWLHIGTGYDHVVGVKSDNTLWSWGGNLRGQLGDNTTVNKSSPVQISSDTDWKYSYAGLYFTVALKQDGTIWTWGYNNYGQIGKNNITNYSSPVQEVTSSTYWQNVRAGSNYVLALKIDGSLWSWGRNNNGQLGTNSIIDRSSPVQVYGNDQRWKSITKNGGILDQNY